MPRLFRRGFAIGVVLLGALAVALGYASAQQSSGRHLAPPHHAAPHQAAPAAAPLVAAFPVRARRRALLARHRANARHILPSTRPDASVVVHADAPLRTIPHSFLGISTEYWALPLWRHHLALLERVLSMIHGPGPLILRVGGDSADQTFWRTRHRLPPWAFELTPRWLHELTAIVHRTGAKLILDLNLFTATPSMAAHWAHIAVTSLPRGSIVGFEIGNEPDLYTRPFWEQETRGDTPRRLPAAITPASYAASFQQDSRALALVAPGIPLLGPALADPVVDLGWIAQLLDGPHPGLAAITVHRYPYSACVPRGNAQYPTIARVLSPAASDGIAHTLSGALRLAAQARLPLRVTELNSVTCGGTAGVSNTFATALWAPDALFAMAHAGVASVNVHVRAYAINAAFSLNRHGLTAHPLLYGMLMFRATLGPDAQLVALRLRRRRVNLAAWAVRSRPGVLRVLLLNKSDRTIRVRVRLPTEGRARIERLLSPSVRATRGLTLAGQHLGHNGRWRGRRVITSVAPDANGYVVSLPRYSGLLLSARLRPGALTGTRHRRGRGRAGR